MYAKTLTSAALIAALISPAAVPAGDVLLVSSQATEASEVATLRAANKALAKEVKREHKRGDKYRLKYLAHKRWWTRSDIEFAAKHTAREQGLGDLEAWAVKACVRTATHEAAKKRVNGSLRYDTKSAKSTRCGLHQWGHEWAGSCAKKQNGVWSCRRFMRVVDEGGKRKVRQHFAQTIGGL